MQSDGGLGAVQKLFDLKKGEVGSSEDKAMHIVCYNCGELGHLCTNCPKPKIYFVCYRKDHMANKCPRWKEPICVVEFLRSASHGLGFFHVNVKEKENRFKLWTGFDNFGIFVLESGCLDQEGIISHLKRFFDQDWPWHLKQLDGSKYLVRFPPDKRVENFVIDDGTYVYLNNGSMMASLKIWNGNIVPIGKLEEVWIQVTGIPPKWCF